MSTAIVSITLLGLVDVGVWRLWIHTALSTTTAIHLPVYKRHLTSVHYLTRRLLSPIPVISAYHRLRPFTGAKGWKQMPFFENAKNVWIGEDVVFEERYPGGGSSRSMRSIVARPHSGPGRSVERPDYYEDGREDGRSRRKIRVEADVVHGYHSPSSPSQQHRQYPHQHQPSHQQHPRHPDRESWDGESQRLGRDVHAKPTKPPWLASDEHISSRSRRRQEHVHGYRKEERREKEATLIDLSESVPDVDGAEKGEKVVKEGEREAEESSYLIDLAGLSFHSRPSSPPGDS